MCKQVFRDFAKEITEDIILYAVFKLPEIDANSFPVLSKKTAASLQEFSEFIDSIGKAALDSKITKAEAEKIRKEGLEAIEKILETIPTADRLAK